MVEAGVSKKLLALVEKNNTPSADIRLQHALLSALRYATLTQLSSPFHHLAFGTNQVKFCVVPQVQGLLGWFCIFWITSVGGEVIATKRIRSNKMVCCTNKF